MNDTRGRGVCVTLNDAFAPSPCVILWFTWEKSGGRVSETLEGEKRRIYERSYFCIIEWICRLGRGIYFYLSESGGETRKSCQLLCEISVVEQRAGEVPRNVLYKTYNWCYELIAALCLDGYVENTNNYLGITQADCIRGVNKNYPDFPAKYNSNRDFTLDYYDLYIKSGTSIFEESAAIDMYKDIIKYYYKRDIIAAILSVN